ncbi:hypothetical protein PARHAE_00208 [Paracoccus haematequi]|uniref:Uncharacterized protein n=1 Tax=Paracoccus haematequi TaxID=2491866 RepID=A0A3S4GKT1_9RHOB|nr:hypothetical protein PARHAE_00208 [Paracoccus haematequi]
MAVAGADFQDGIAIDDPHTPGLRREIQLPHAADHTQHGQIQAVAAQLVIGDGHAPVEAGQGKDIRAVAAGQGDVGLGRHQDIVAGAAVQMGRGKGRHQQVVARRSRGHARVGKAGGAQGARIDDKLRHPGFPVGRDQQHDPAVHHHGFDGADPAQGHVVGVGDGLQVQQPAVGQQGEDADAAIRAARDHIAAPVHLGRGEGRHRLEPRRQFVQDVVRRGQGAGPVQPEHRQRGRRRPRRHQKAVPAELQRRDVRGDVIAQPLGREMYRPAAQRPVAADRMGRDEVAQSRNRHQQGLAVDGNGNDLVQRRLGHAGWGRQGDGRDRGEAAVGIDPVHLDRQLAFAGGNQEPAVVALKLAAGGQARADPLGREQLAQIAQAALVVEGQPGGARAGHAPDQQAAPGVAIQDRQGGPGVIGEGQRKGGIRRALQRRKQIADAIAADPAGGIQGKQHPVRADPGHGQIGDVRQPAMLRGPIGDHVTIRDHLVRWMRVSAASPLLGRCLTEP